MTPSKESVLKFRIALLLVLAAPMLVPPAAHADTTVLGNSATDGDSSFKEPANTESNYTFVAQATGFADRFHLYTPTIGTDHGTAGQVELAVYSYSANPSTIIAHCLLTLPSSPGDSWYYCDDSEAMSLTMGTNYGLAESHGGEQVNILNHTGGGCTGDSTASDEIEYHPIGSSDVLGNWNQTGNYCPVNYAQGYNGKSISAYVEQTSTVTIVGDDSWTSATAGINHHDILVYNFTSRSNASSYTLNHLYGYVGAGPNATNYYLGLYDSDGTGGQPGTRLRSCSTTIVASQVNGCTVADLVLSNSHVYYIGAWADGTTNYAFKEGQDGTASLANEYYMHSTTTLCGTYGFPNSWGDSCGGTYGSYTNVSLGTYYGTNH